ncbi:MAG: carboxypeptidase [Crocinitomicaceae bacterium]|nr:carboxypeptidase [Crocinitomicaceae bacterium]
MKIKTHILTLLLVSTCVCFIHAQTLNFPTDTVISKNGQVTIKGQKIDYTVKTGMQPVWDESGEVIATLHYTYYQRKGINDLSKRPLMISFNGGPGSASAWMHIAYTGPKLLNVDDEGYPIQPYGMKDNPYSVLDVTDILYVNPVNTGYSRTIPVAGKEVKRDQFFGINADINYLSEWLNTFVNRNDRWLSPKYLIGESYGGTRVSGLAYALQEKQWMYLNGVILVSPADYNIFNSDPAIYTATNFPYYTATAWYHGLLPEPNQQMALQDILMIAEDFALQELMPALAKGSSLGQADREMIAQKMTQLTGISTENILQQNLNLTPSFFWKDLRRKKDGTTIGRLDSRYLGIDKVETGDAPDYNAELKHWLHAFTPAINYYMRNELGFQTDLKYNMFGDVHPWDRRNNQTREQLRKAMAANPYLNVLFQAGYYDGATTYFASKYTMWQIDPSGKMKDRFRFIGYESGHMMYLRKVDLEKANEDIREFIIDTNFENKPAKYK